MHEFEKTVLWPQGAQGFDDSELDTAATVHRQPMRFVEDEETSLLIEDARLQMSGQFRTRRWLGMIGRQTQGRNTYLITTDQTLIDARPTAIDPDLAGAHDAIDERARRSFQAAEQKIVQSLPGVSGIDQKLLRLPAFIHKKPLDFS